MPRGVDLDQGESIHELMRQLFPLHRAITGEGLRKTLDIIENLIPLNRIEVATGTEVFDWTVPQEWWIQDAFIADAMGCRVVDYAKSNLHVVSYSAPVDTRLDWGELESHVHRCETIPEAIPYRTTYFRENWGFCVTQDQYAHLSDGGPWQVQIQAGFKDGALSLAECEIRGESDETILLYAHTCHPSLANDNLSGVAIATYLARWLREKPRRYSYRIIFSPATIGAIAWLSLQETQRLEQVKYGLVLSLLGDGADFTFKQSCVDGCGLHTIVPRALDQLHLRCRELPFSPFGYDERQFASPGIRLPVGRLSRSEYASFPEYHSSRDDLDFVTAENLGQSFDVCREIIETIEANTYPVNRRPFGEPNLGRHKLYRAFGEHDDRGRIQQAMMWVLNLADGRHDLSAISKRSGLALAEIRRAVTLLEQNDLLEQSYHPVSDQMSRFGQSK